MKTPIPGPDRELGDGGADQPEHARGAVYPRVLRHAGLLGRATEDLRDGWTRQVVSDRVRYRDGVDTGYQVGLGF